jgi:hypothetical protein
VLFEHCFAYSKKIMGYVADNMNTESSVKALNMAIKQERTRKRH